MKRATVYFDEDLHKALKIRAAESESSLSDLVNDAVKGLLREDIEDLHDIHARKNEKPVSYEQFVKSLRKSGKL